MCVNHRSGNRAKKIPRKKYPKIEVSFTYFCDSIARAFHGYETFFPETKTDLNRLHYVGSIIYNPFFEHQKLHASNVANVLNCQVDKPELQILLQNIVALTTDILINELSAEEYNAAVIEFMSIVDKEFEQTHILPAVLKTIDDDYFAKKRFFDNFFLLSTSIMS